MCGAQRSLSWSGMLPLGVHDFAGVAPNLNSVDMTCKLRRVQASDFMQPTRRRMSWRRGGTERLSFSLYASQAVGSYHLTATIMGQVHRHSPQSRYKAEKELADATTYVESAL